MKKIDRRFVISSYDQGIENYREAVKKVGLWQSEKYTIEKYFKPAFAILDIGCGAGRTTFGLWEMGYEDLQAIDLNPQMIQAARSLATGPFLSIPFDTGDATRLNFDGATFDGVLFSFNGIMTIPEKSNRSKAFREIYRILKPGGVFIFTAHDRERDAQYRAFWEAEAARWEAGRQDRHLYEFGDVISYSHDVRSEIFIHIPKRAEIAVHLEESGFELQEDFYRPDLFEESGAVRQFSGECRFWVVRKPLKDPIG